VSRTLHNVAVVMPVFNGEAYVGEALRSVIDQTQPPAEILVIDDASTDGTARVLASFGSAARVVRQERQGAGAARNAGAALARSDYVAFLDADDLWTPDALQRLAEPVERDGAVWTAGLIRQFISPDLPPDEAARLFCPAGDAFARAAGSMLFRRETFLAVGGFDPAFRTGEFMDLAARLEDAGVRAAPVNHLIVRRRLHASNMMREGRARQMEYLRVLAATRARRRDAGTAPLSSTP
jgi:glycosyltransferase involved in cell wall biosynthesis